MSRIHIATTTVAPIASASPTRVSTHINPSAGSPAPAPALPEPLLPQSLREMPNTYTFDRNLGTPPLCTAENLGQGTPGEDQGGDMLGQQWSRLRARLQLAGCASTERKNGCADF